MILLRYFEGFLQYEPAEPINHHPHGRQNCELVEGAVPSGQGNQETFEDSAVIEFFSYSEGVRGCGENSEGEPTGDDDQKHNNFVEFNFDDPMILFLKTFFQK